MDDQQFHQLLQYLHLSWPGYRKVRKGVKKRIRRHMRRLKCPGIGEYLIELERSKEARDECDRLMTVPISRFFRDKALWEILQEKILPGLIREQTEKIPVWSAGCASGEEVYSLKIIYESLHTSDYHSPKLMITATDMNPACLERARDGSYPASSLKELPERFRSMYFESKTGKKGYNIKAFLKKDIIWRTHNLLGGIPGSRFQIIFLRNCLLTYYHDEIKISALKKVLTCLAPGGFLIIGSHEILPFETSELHHYGPLSYVFNRQDRGLLK